MGWQESVDRFFGESSGKAAQGSEIKALEDLLLREAVQNKGRKNFSDYFQKNNISDKEIYEDILRKKKQLSLKKEMEEKVRKVKEEQRLLYGINLDKLKSQYENKLKIEQKKSPNGLEVGKLENNYQLFLNDGTVQNPFIISSDLFEIVRDATKECKGDKEKAHEIFRWFLQNVKYGDSKRGYKGYRNSKEVLEGRQGVCGEMAFLYVTMARSVGLKSNYVSVKRDNRGKDVHHACASVDIDGGIILVDPAYNSFEIKHVEWYVLSDMQAIENFRQWRGFI